MVLNRNKNVFLLCKLAYAYTRINLLGGVGSRVSKTEEMVVCPARFAPKMICILAFWRGRKFPCL